MATYVLYPPIQAGDKKTCYQLHHNSTAAFFLPSLTDSLPFCLPIPISSDLLVRIQWCGASQETSVQTTMVQPGDEPGHPALKAVV